MLIDILFTWAKLNPDISYRQGMHEIAAPILWVVERDAIDPSSISNEISAEDEAALKTFASDNIEHDTFTLFNAVMAELKSAYEHTSEGRGQGPSKTSISARCTGIMEGYMSRLDPALAEHLLDIGVVPQVFLLSVFHLDHSRDYY